MRGLAGCFAGGARFGTTSGLGILFFGKALAEVVDKIGHNLLQIFHQVNDKVNQANQAAQAAKQEVTQLSGLVLEQVNSIRKLQSSWECSTTAIMEQSKNNQTLMTHQADNIKQLATAQSSLEHKIMQEAAATRNEVTQLASSKAEQQQNWNALAKSLATEVEKSL